mmetsp:Transcript_81967/g.208310  ORF Transcript_81967/g.208310 Transcript_81967/m.208310 type:complete len:132 (-) Transcript_81967:3-398(-)
MSAAGLRSRRTSPIASSNFRAAHAPVAQPSGNGPAAEAEVAPSRAGAEDDGAEDDDDDEDEGDIGNSITAGKPRNAACKAPTPPLPAREARAEAGKRAKTLRDFSTAVAAAIPIKCPRRCEGEWGGSVVLV